MNNVNESKTGLASRINVNGEEFRVTEEMLDILYAEAVGTGHEDDDEWLDTYDILAAHYPGGMFPEDRHA